MSKLTPNEIFLAFKKNQLDIHTTLNYLKFYIEECETEIFRDQAINYLREIGKINDFKIDKFLNDCLISDKNPIIRSTAAKIIINKNLKESYKLLKYIIKNENSTLVIITIFNLLKLIKSNISSDLQEQIINKFALLHDVDFEESKFLLDLYSLGSEIGINLEINREYISEHICYDNFLSRESNHDINPLFVIRQNHIREIDIFWWKLRKIPDSIGSLSKLTFLTFRGELISDLPDSFKLLKQLKCVNLYGFPTYKNRPNYVPEWVNYIAKTYYSKKYIKNGVKKSEAYVLGLFDLLIGTEIKLLNKDVNMENMPKSIGYRQDSNGHVIGLYLPKCEPSKLFILPEKIGQLKWLIDFDLNNNNIREVPNTIGFLSSLKTLDLRFNKIKKLPRSIKSLKTLEYIGLKGNCINKVPRTIRKLIFLK
ncbi:MAG: hypothetical protein ACFFAO_04890 [Candidatus Hermodarchaeota archaeon]